MLIAYLILTVVVSSVVLLGTANRYDSYNYWKYWLLSTVVWPLLILNFAFVRVRRAYRSKMDK